MISINSGEQRARILIADDSEMNRAILAEMLEDEYDILEAENGTEAVAIIQEQGMNLSLILLDIVMPEMDGFGVLTEMNRNHWIEDIPVIMISAERGAEQIERAYQLGATDFISRPFDALIVHKRVVNTILLYTKQKNLVSLVAQQMYEKEEQSTLMIDILGHIVEFRNGESGMHVRHVHTLTEMFLKALNKKENPYHFTQSEISIIATASALHDIGKISIPENILNKPGKLTDEEFDLMKTHTTIGADMLENLPIHQDKPLVRISYEICRWHHERYDGRGYPDGLVGDNIPISAQIVSLADVYDALTSKRVYKEPYSHEKATQMILNGECGMFNPLLLDCLTELSDDIQQELNQASTYYGSSNSMHNVAEEILQNKELSVSKRTVQLLEHERVKHEFFAALSDEIQFEFTLTPPTLTLTPFGAKKLGFPEIINDPLHNPRVLELSGRDAAYELSDRLRSTSPGMPVVTFDCLLTIDGAQRWHHIVARATWSTDEPPRYIGAIGKSMDIHNSRMHLDALERQASTDSLTGLLNHASAKKQIQSRLADRPNGKYALAILDLDFFKSANDTHGHQFGDELLKFMAEQLRVTIRGGDIVARVGGDEFLIFLEYKDSPHAAIHRIYSSLCNMYESFPISMSMGVARTDTVGYNYDNLFHAADTALYTVKRSGRGNYQFYDPSMDDVLSSISPIVTHEGSDQHNLQEGKP